MFKVPTLYQEKVISHQERGKSKKKIEKWIFPKYIFSSFPFSFANYCIFDLKITLT